MRAAAKRAAAALAACVLLLTGCGGEPASGIAAAVPAPEPTPAPAVVEDGVLTLGHIASTGYNPYRYDSTLVAHTGGLLFEKLVEITPEMDVEYRLAEAIHIAGEVVTIHLRGGCVFADGTPITAEDVRASLLAAKASPLYGGQLGELLDVKVDGSSLTLTLSRPDCLFAYLCDLPVLKAAEVALDRPTASGRYTYGEGDTLVKNTRAPFPQEGPDLIRLADVSSYEEMVSGLAVGTLNLYAAVDGETSSAGYYGQESYYRTNNLVFLGVNAARENPLLNTPAARAMLSQLLDRRQLADESYYGRAYPATGAINSFYPCVNSQQVIHARQDAEGAAALFESMGYAIDPQSGYYADAEGRRLEASLLVYTGSTYKKYAASLIRQQLAAQGVQITLQEIDNFETYSQLIAAGEFDLYIGEVKLYNNMDMTPFFAGTLCPGTAVSEALTAAYEAFRANKGAAGAFEAAFAAEMPYVPLLWRSGTVVAARSVSGVTSSLSNLFFSLSALA